MRPTTIGRALLTAGLVAVAVALPPARGIEPGGGLVRGTVSCESGRGSLDLASAAVVYSGAVRSGVSVALGDECKRLSPDVVYAQGAARITGGGIACGTDPAKPFVGRFMLETGGRFLVAGFSGSCIIDGAEQHAVFGAEGVVADGAVTGTFRPDEPG